MEHRPLVMDAVLRLRCGLHHFSITSAPQVMEYPAGVFSITNGELLMEK